MIKVNVEVVLYTIDELKEEARYTALKEHRDVLLSMFDVKDYDWDMDYDTYKEGLTDFYVIEMIEANEYLYYANGVMARTKEYTGKHERTGDHILIIKESDVVYADPKEYILKSK